MSFWRDIKNSIFSFPFYKEVKERPVSRAVKFLLRLAALTTVLISIRLSFDALYWIEKIGAWMEESLPEITVTGGQASSPAQQPYQIEAEGKNFVFVLDTTGAIQEVPAQYPSGILVTKNRLIFKENNFQKREYDLAQLSGVALNKQTIGELKRILKILAVPLLTVGLFLYLFFARLIQVLFFSLISVVINLAGGIGLSYQAMFAIGVYALVPCSLLGTLVALIGKPLLLFPAVYLSSYLTYLVIGILQCKR